MTEGFDLPIAALERLTAESLGISPPLALDEILGGASTRRFFRLRRPEGASVIVMFAPVQGHELGKDDAKGRPWPYLEIRDLLARHAVRVPALLSSACEDGLLLLEDLGETLAKHLTEHPEQREQLYAMAVRDLARAQRELDPLPDDSIIVGRAFDEELLLLEVDHFREWALDAQGIALGAAERDVFERAAHTLARTIAGWPRGFVHRDYQSRNLMVVHERGGGLSIGWVDFQDALLGPRIYDMVALLNDSYQTFSPSFVEARLDEFTTELCIPPSERAAIGREFRLVTVQRKLKDAGRFVFIDRVRGNPSFLGFVAPTIEKAQKALDDLRDDPDLDALSLLLERLFPRA